MWAKRPSYQKLHIATAPGNFWQYSKSLIKIVTVIVDLNSAFLGHRLKSTMGLKELMEGLSAKGVKKE